MASLETKMKKIIATIQKQFPIIIVDEPLREAEGDLYIAAECATPETLAFMAKEGRGLMCLPCAGYILDRLEIPRCPTNGLDKYATPFCSAIDSVDCDTGVSVTDRMKTIKVLTNPNSVPSQLLYPGHLFPLRPRKELLKVRKGHSEASTILSLLAGFQPISVIIEIMNSDGSMLKQKDLAAYEKKFNLQTVYISELEEYISLTNWTCPIDLG